MNDRGILNSNVICERDPFVIFFFNLAKYMCIYGNVIITIFWNEMLITLHSGNVGAVLDVEEMEFVDVERMSTTGS